MNTRGMRTAGITGLRWLGMLGLGAATVFVAACGGSDGEGDPSGETPAIVTREPTASATATATSTEPVTATTTPVTASPTPEDDGDGLIAAAAAATDGIHVSPLSLEACQADNPEGRACFDVVSGEQTQAAGLVHFTGGFPDGGVFNFVMARDSNGDWGYWFSSQAPTYVATDLPAGLLACGGGADVPVTTTPGGTTTAGTIAELETMEADGFVLTGPGTFGINGERGTGAYHITAPMEGWVDATLASYPATGGCALRDSFEGGQHG